MCAGIAGLGAIHVIAMGIPTGDGPFLGRCSRAGTACIVARFSIRSAPLPPTLWGGADGPPSAIAGHLVQVTSPKAG